MQAEAVRRLNGESIARPLCRHERPAARTAARQDSRGVLDDCHVERIIPNMRLTGAWIAAFAAAACLGCHEPGAPAGPTVARVTAADEQEFDRLWDSTADVLRAHNLWPDRQDRLSRVITTFPDTSPQYWEFWRPFPTSDFARLEANIGTVRRQAEVRFAATAQANEYDLSVRVDVERYCLAERQATDAASAFQLFGAKLPTAEGRAEPGQADAYWLPIGRDGQMESALLDRILRRYGGEGYRTFQAESAATTQPAAATTAP